MTLRTIDIDTETLDAGTMGTAVTTASLTTRHARARRRNAIMTPRRFGCRVSGFGF